MKSILKNSVSKIKYVILFISVFSFGLPLYAEIDTVRTDTIVYYSKDGEKCVYVEKVKVIEKKPKHFIGVKFIRHSKYYTDLFVDWGFNRADKYNLFNNRGEAGADAFPKLVNSKSQAFSLYLMGGRRIANGFSIMSGIGFDWLNYRFSKDVTLREINDVVKEVFLEDIYENYNHVEKTKLTASYFSVPLLLRLNLRKFFVAAGVTGSVNIGSHTRIRYFDSRGNEHKIRNYDVTLATLRYGYTARAGFGCFGVFANYYMTPLFSKGEGPQAYPFTIGLSLKL